MPRQRFPHIAVNARTTVRDRHTHAALRHPHIMGRLANAEQGTGTEQFIASSQPSEPTHVTIRQHPRNRRQHACRQDQHARASPRRAVREDRSVQPARLGQGSPRPRRDRGRRAIGRAPAGPDGDRGNQRQHGHRPRDGLRAEGISTRRHDGRELQRRAPQTHALPRRQGHPDAGARGRHRHGAQSDRARRSERLVSYAPVRERGERGLPLSHDGARNHQRLRGRAARLLGHGHWNWRNAQGRRSRARQGASGDASRRVRAVGRATPEQRDEAGTQAGRIARLETSILEATPDSGVESRLHSEARGRRGGRGLRRSASSRFPTSKRFGGAASSRRRRESSSASRRAARSPAPCRCAPTRRKARRSSACCRTRASAISARRSLRTFRRK